MVTALGRNRPDIPPSRLDRLRDLMNAAVRDCLVSGYEPLIEGLKLPDPGDRHVLAAAIKSGAQAIVTRNLEDFPAYDLEPWDIEAKSPDAFVLDQAGINGRAVAASVRQSGRSIRPADRGLPDQLAGVSGGCFEPIGTRWTPRIRRSPPRGLAGRRAATPKPG